MADIRTIKSNYHDSTIERSKFVAAITPVSVDSIFGDKVWKMHALVNLPGITKTDAEWDFSLVPGFPGGFALALAEYAYARLYKPAKSHDRMAEWLTVLNELYSLNDLAKFCAKVNYASFDEVDVKDCEQYLNLITYSDKKSEDRVRVIFLHIYRFWEYGSAISQPIKMLPLGKKFKDVFGSSRRNNEENATPTIPEAIFAPLMKAALDYVDTYADSILTAFDNARLTYLEAKLSGKSKSQSQDYLLNKTKEYLQHNHIHAGRHTANEGMQDLYNEVYILRTACILIVLAYSGIRSSELLSLRAGCCHLGKGADGSQRHFIEAMLYKYRGVGTIERWVVIEEVHKAIKLIERITENIRKDTGDNRLLVSDGSNRFLSVSREYTNANLNELTFDSIIYQINRFREHSNAVLNRAPIPDHIDEQGNLVPWKFNCRQFRRTLARYIARQPFGIIAGMLQYKHIQVTIFEGYAGSEPEWNKMLADEKILSNVNILDELAIDLAQGAVAGDFGIKLKTQFEAEFRGRVEDFPPSQIAKWLLNSNKELFVGKFNFCFFDPTKALCTSSTGNSSKPNLNFCSPDQCGNACVSKRHSPLWKAQLEQAEQLAMHPKASEYQRNALAGEIYQIRSILDSIGEK